MTAPHFNKKVVQLEQLRVVANLTQVQLATICGFSAASNWSRLVAAARSGSEMRPRFETEERVEAGITILMSELKLKRVIPLKTLKTNVSLHVRVGFLRAAVNFHINPLGASTERPPV